MNGSDACVRVERSGGLSSACGRFLHEIGTWAHACMERYAAAPPTDVHDQATYTTGWEPYIAATGDPGVLAFVLDLRERIAEHFVRTGAWRHGYWTMHEVHHGTEHFELFLGMLLRLVPADPKTAAQLIDVAEHMGNWSPDVEPWFDPERRLFRSSYFGTSGVRLEPGMEVNLPDHFRCANICLLAYRAVGDPRLLSLAEMYVGQWADAILAADSLPVALAPTGPLYGLSADAERTYRGFAGQAPANFADARERAENLLASDGVGTLLTLWKIRGGDRFRRAAERLLDLLTTQLADPDAGAVAAAVRVYRCATGDRRYDILVRTALRGCEPRRIETLTLDLAWRPDQRPQGIGKREDMLRWLENDQPRHVSPLTLALLAEIEGDVDLATQAVDLAHAYLRVARDLLPDGRDHGCAARSVSAVARGHGRENHAGMTTAVLQPVLETFFPGQRW